MRRSGSFWLMDGWVFMVTETFVAAALIVPGYKTAISAVGM
jgi:hypothetical protein